MCIRNRPYNQQKYNKNNFNRLFDYKNLVYNLFSELSGINKEREWEIEKEIKVDLIEKILKVNRKE